MPEDFVKDSEQIIKLLETMALRGAKKPIKVSDYSTDNILLQPEETEQIVTYVVSYRKILSTTGIKELPPSPFDIDSKKSFTVPTSEKLMYLSSRSTSSSYCLTVISEIEEAVSQYIISEIREIKY